MPTIRVVVKSRFPQLTVAAQALAEAAIAKAAHDIEAHAKAAAPVDTGLLRNSITSRREGRLAWVVESPVDYSVYQEYGTSRMAARPYMTPAVEIVRPRLLSALRGIV